MGLSRDLLWGRKLEMAKEGAGGDWQPVSTLWSQEGGQGGAL